MMEGGDDEMKGERQRKRERGRGKKEGMDECE